MRRRLEQSADHWIHDHCEDASANAAQDRFRPVAGRQRLAWYAVALSLVLAIAGWWPRLQSLGPGVMHPLSSPAERARLHLIETVGPALGRWAWAHESGLVASVQGEVVWDGERQEGYLTVTGLEPSRRSGRQYQLWIFDAARDDRYPVDGGVFDVADDGEAVVTVPFRPSLRVSQPLAFAITLEPAGGVVVSDRTRLMAMARTTPR